MYLFLVTYSILGNIQNESDSIKYELYNFDAPATYQFSRVNLQKVYLNDALVADEQKVEDFTLSITDTTEGFKLKLSAQAYNFSFSEVPETADENDLMQYMVEMAQYELAQLPVYFYYNKHEHELIKLQDEFKYNDAITNICNNVALSMQTHFDYGDEIISDIALNIKEYIETTGFDYSRKGTDLIVAYFGWNYLSDYYNIQSDSTTQIIPLIKQESRNPIPIKASYSFKSAMQNRFVLKEAFDYDKEAFLKEAKRYNELFASIKEDEIDVVVRNVIEFPNSKNYIQQISLETLMVMPQTKIIDIENIKLRKQE